MPTYVYRRDDGSSFEFEQSIQDDALTTCPTTGQPVERVPQAFGYVRLPKRFYKEKARLAGEGPTGAAQRSSEQAS